MLGKEDVKPRIIAAKDVATAATLLAQSISGQMSDVQARQYSQAPTAAASGELPWVSFNTSVTEGLPFEVAQVIAQLPLGGVLPKSNPLDNDAVTDCTQLLRSTRSF